MRDVFTGAVADIMTLLVIIELFRSFIEYFKARRVRLKNMMDPSIIIVMRKLVVGLYKVHFAWEELLGYSVLIVSLGIVRTLAVLFSPTRNAKQENRNNEDYSQIIMQKNTSASLQT